MILCVYIYICAHICVSECNHVLWCAILYDTKYEYAIINKYTNEQTKISKYTVISMCVCDISVVPQVSFLIVSLHVDPGKLCCPSNSWNGALMMVANMYDEKVAKKC